ncbi:CO/xanthine dehydrogenase Mo-binding subunit [Bradyrhizobium sp. i1.3.1]
MLFAVMAVASIARGRVTSLDVAGAKRHPGVVDVMTPDHKPQLAIDPEIKTNPFVFRMEVLQSDEVRYANQPIAVVIAETLEAATEGAVLLAPRYETLPALVGLDAGESYVPPVVGVGNPTENHLGDVEAGLAAAEKQIDAIYETPPQYHNAMEPHAIVAAWNGDSLQIDMPTQGLMLSLARVAELFGIAHDKIHIRSPFLGGGFGSKGLMAGPPVLGIMAAKLVGKPVKLVLRREQMYGPVGHRAPTRQRLRIGTDGEGRLTALDHHARTVSSTFDDFYEPAADASHTLYASPSIRTSHDAVRVNTGTPPVHACARRGHRLDRARKRDRRNGLGLRHRSAGFPPEELRRGRADHWQAVFVQGAACLLRAGRGALRLVEAFAPAAADARRCWPSRRLGHGHRDLPGADVPGRSARGAPPRR